MKINISCSARSHVLLRLEGANAVLCSRRESWCCFKTDKAWMLGKYLRRQKHLQGRRQKMFQLMRKGVASVWHRVTHFFIAEGLKSVVSDIVFTWLCSYNALCVLLFRRVEAEAIVIIYFLLFKLSRTVCVLYFYLLHYTDGSVWRLSHLLSRCLLAHSELTDSIVIHFEWQWLNQRQSHGAFTWITVSTVC